MRSRGIPGLQLVVVRHGHIILQRSYGTANIQDSIPVTNTTGFNIASITKMFTGVAIMQLAESGKLQLSAPVAIYLDSLPVAWQKVTVRQLLTHTSGLPEIHGESGLLGAGSPDSAWKQVQRLPMEFVPGDHFSYNQTNYLLLGKIIEKLSGQPFTRFITLQQLKPLGLQHTLYGDVRELVPHSARGYCFYTDDEPMKRLDRLVNVFEPFPPFLLTAAGMYSTATDIAHWLIALQSGKLLKQKSSVDTLWASGRFNDGRTGSFGGMYNGYALGWPVIQRAKHPAVAPVGGGRTAVFVYPADDLSIIVLTNLKRSNPESFIDELAGFYIPEMSVVNGFGFSSNIQQLAAMLQKKGFNRAVSTADFLQQQNPSFHLQENPLNSWGYALLNAGRKKEALEIFKLVVHLYPNSWNAYDSEAEGYENLDDKQHAIAGYKRSLELNPDNQNAVEHLQKLGALKR